MVQLIRFNSSQYTPEQLTQLGIAFYEWPLQKQLKQEQFAQIQKLLSQRQMVSPTQKFFLLQEFMSQLTLKQNFTDDELNWFINELNRLPQQKFTQEQYVTLVAQFYQLPLDRQLTPEQFAYLQNQMYNISTQISTKFPLSGQVTDERFAEIMNQFSRLASFPTLTDEQFNQLMNELKNFNSSHFTPEQLIELGIEFTQLPFQTQLTPQQYAEFQLQITKMTVAQQDLTNQKENFVPESASTKSN